MQETIKNLILNQIEKTKKKLLEKRQAIIKKWFQFEGDFKLIDPEKNFLRWTYKEILPNIIFKKIYWYWCIDEYGQNRLFEHGTLFECVGEYNMTMAKFIN